MKMPSRMGMIGMAGILLLLPLSVGCGGGDDDDDDLVPLAEPTVEQQSTLASSEHKEEIVINIGHIADLTGVSARSNAVMSMALDDLVEHYNNKNLIPGVKLNVITYDGQYDPSRDIPGYEWLIEKGADFIFTMTGGTPVTLNPRVNQDKVVLFAATVDLEELLPRGFMFDLGVIPQHEAYTLLKWIAENDWDYQTKGPAKIGAASWLGGYSEYFLAVMEEYARAHPDQFEWVGGYLTNMSFTWGPEVAALMECDYVNPCPLMSSFVQEYREAGGKAKLFGSDAQAAFLGMIDDGNLWDEIDGMLLVRSVKWWNEDGAQIDLAKELIYENHPDSAQDVIREGTGYLAGINLGIQMIEIIADAVETVGPENFDSQALYNSAVSYSRVVDGVERASFGETKRYSLDYFAIYEARSTEENLFNVDPQWYPAILEP